MMASPFTPDNDIPPPPGVTLRDPTDYAGRRTDLYDRFKSSMIETFPQTYGGVSVHLDNVDYEGDVDDSPENEKKLILNGGDLYRRLRGDMILKDATSGVELERKRMTLAQVPHLSPRGTFILGGNDYTVLSQDRLRPGTYVRRKKNGQMEAQVNSLMGSGPSVRVSMDPDSSVFYLEKQTSRWKLYPILRAMGYEDSDLKSRWGDHVWSANRDKSNDKSFDAAYAKLVRDADPQASKETKAQQLKEVFESIRLHRDVVAKTLPNLFQTKVAAEWKEAAIKLDAMPFKPDRTFDEMTKSRNMILGKHGPLLGGSREWPDKWKSEDGKGWMDWYEGWCAGKRTDKDGQFIRRWKAMHNRAVPQFKKTMSPRWAAVLENWAIDPTKHVAPEKMKDYESSRSRHHDEMSKAHWSGHFAKTAAATDLTAAAIVVADYLGHYFDPRGGREKAAAYFDELDAAGIDVDRLVTDLDMDDKQATAAPKPLPLLDPKTLKPAVTAPPADPFPYKNDPAYQWYAGHVRTQEARDAVARKLKFQDAQKNWQWKAYKDPAGLWVSGYGTRIYEGAPKAPAKPAPHEIWVPKGTDLNKWTMPESRAEELLHHSIHSKMGVVQRNYDSTYGAGAYATLPMFARAALAEGPYMGVPKTPKAYEAARAGKWEDMAGQLKFNYSPPGSTRVIPLTARNEALLAGLREMAAKKPVTPTAPAR